VQLAGRRLADDAIHQEEQGRRQSKARLILLALLLLVLVAAAVLWVQRRQIASDFIDRELERRGVQASYRVTGIGMRTQRIEDVVIGDPANPDLTAKSVEVGVGLGGLSPEVRTIRARGVRLNARIADGRLQLGEIDKLLPPPSGAPFSLPDVRLDFADTQIRLATPVGDFLLNAAGDGNLTDGFDGRVRAIAEIVDTGGCRLDQVAGSLRLRIDDRRPLVEGPLGASRLGCAGPDLMVLRPQLQIDASLSPTLESWRGNAGFALPRSTMASHRLSGVSGSLTFDGSAAQTAGSARVAVAAAEIGGVEAGETQLRGRYAWSPSAGVSLLTDVAAQDVVLDPAVAALQPALAGLAGLPVEPIARQLLLASRAAARQVDFEGRLRFVSHAGGGALRIERLDALAPTGARMQLGGGDGWTYYLAGGGSRLDGRLSVAGGGLPAVDAALQQPSAAAPLSGIVRIEELRAGNARLQLAPIRFTRARGGSTRFDTGAVLSGPFYDGYVRDLALPISGTFGNGGFSAIEGCTALSFRGLRAAGLTLRGTWLRLCPTGRAVLLNNGNGLTGGATIAEPRLAGTLGGSPIQVAADRVRFTVADPGFMASRLAVRLGAEGAVHRLYAAEVAGDFTSRGVVGRFTGLDAKLARVPLLLSEGAGNWSVIAGDLALEGGVTVADEAEPSRFYPLRSEDFALTLAGGRIDAGGWLIDPETGTRVTQVAITHDLSQGSGQARLDVPGITFNPDYQPEELTRLTTGVVALVDGTVSGSGRIDWGPNGVTSTGRFGTQGMDLAAAFGPVEGLATSITFTDLLGLVSAPDQIATADLIRSGIDVYDGRVRYQLLPDLNVRVAGGEWPVAGGQLLLQETMLDFSRPSAKRLTFLVRGFDAGRFIETLEFDNIAATGTFDGVIPMVFEQIGGRIEGGRLIARNTGGTLSYIGELTDEDLGIYGKLAFDALKSLRYSKLDIGLDGSLDGEFLTVIELDGIARDPALAPVDAGGISGIVARRALRQLARIPFEFNITARGPFRALLATARSLEDPTLLIQSALPANLQELATQADVQPQESENQR
jgi:translocation and assembly module TamB